MICFAGCSFGNVGMSVEELSSRDAAAQKIVISLWYVVTRKLAIEGAELKCLMCKFILLNRKADVKPGLGLVEGCKALAEPAGAGKKVDDRNWICGRSGHLRRPAK